MAADLMCMKIRVLFGAFGSRGKKENMKWQVGSCIVED